RTSTTAASTATPSATMAASTRSSIATAVRVLSPARLSRPSTASANTTRATSISTSENPALRPGRRGRPGPAPASAMPAIDLHHAAAVDRDAHALAVAHQHHPGGRGRAGGIEADRQRPFPPGQLRPGARRPLHGGEGAALDGLPAIEAAAREAVAARAHRDLHGAHAEDG